MIEIIKVQTKKEKKAFVDFPIKLYKGNKYYVPAIYADEMSIFTEKNIYYRTCDSVYFLAKKDGKYVGRIQGIIQKQSNELRHENRVRFTRFDCIDDLEVAKALFNAIENWGKEKGMDTICGPLGYSDLEREGLLIEGFNEFSTYAEQYNYPYYENLIVNLGFEKEVEWHEFKVKYPEVLDKKISRVASRTLELNKLHLPDKKLSKRKLLKRYGDGIFCVLDECYKELYGTVPFTDDMKKQMLSQFNLFISKKWLLIILDENDEVVSFAFCMPQIGKVLQKSGGKLTLLTLLRLLRAIRKPKVIEFCLICVLPKYQAKGVNSIALNGIIEMLKKDIDYCETNLCLDNNSKILAQWKYFNAENHKKRRAYMKKI